MAEPTSSPLPGEKTVGALVLFSGGQDSATCLAWALNRYDHVETVGFAYGQRHAVELEARQRLRSLYGEKPGWADRLGPDHLLSIPTFSEIGETAMTADLPITAGETGLPTTFVPGRNLAFLTFAGALAAKQGLTVLVGGMCETDNAGYPDCRAATIDAMQTTLRLGLAAPIAVETPLMHLTKGQTWALAKQVGGEALVDLIVEHSHTCYRGDRSQRHDWGYGCGECPACEERARGWAAYCQDAGQEVSA